MVSLDKARDFVHANGVLWERVLWDHLFDDAPLERLHRGLLAYKNPDDGWGYALEHDIRAPASNPLQLEFLLAIFRDTGLSPGPILEGSGLWAAANQNDDGTFRNPPRLLEYPHAPWWSEGGQSIPDAITGNLIKHGACPPAVAEATRRWAQTHLTIDDIRANEWLFMAYHAHDYFFNVVDYPNLAAHKEATIDNIIQCARAHEKAGESDKYYTLFSFARTPEGEVARALPSNLLQRFLEHLASAQRDDGGWNDEHGLPQWQPYVSTIILLALKEFQAL